MLTYKDILFSTTKKISDKFNCDVIVEDVKCALSKKDIQTMTSDGVGNLAFSHLLFLNPNVDVREGDVVEVSSMGKISIYLASKPFYYSSHSETLLSYKERA